MASDLTERLAAKLVALGVGGDGIPCDCGVCLQYRERVTKERRLLLPLLLSEPELVAGLAPEAKREVLRQLLGEQLDELAPDGRVGLPFVVNLTHGFKVFHADACEADPDTAMAKVRAALLDFLAPEAR